SVTGSLMIQTPTPPARLRSNPAAPRIRASPATKRFQNVIGVLRYVVSGERKIVRTCEPPHYAIRNHFMSGSHDSPLTRQRRWASSVRKPKISYCEMVG